MATVSALPSLSPDPSVLLVRFDRVYGRITCYPVSESACLVAQLAGKKTLGPQDLTIARRLGFKLQLMPGSMALIEDFIQS